MDQQSHCNPPVGCASCPHHSDEILTYHRYVRGKHFPVVKCTQSAMLFVMKGDLLINSEEYPGTTVHEGQFILQAIGSKLELLALTNVSYILFRFTEPPLLCERLYNEILNHSEAPLVYSPLTVIPKLKVFLNSLVLHFQDSPILCEKFAKLKGEELMYLLTTGYPFHTISAFFYPISTYTESFHYFVMQNWERVKNVEEFAHLGGYTTNTFRRLFKNMYNAPVYEWILDKKRVGILDDLRYTKQSISTISARYGFESLSHFAHFCKDSFGDTPRSLRKRMADGEQIVPLKSKVDEEITE